jgi:hypothetical protein
MSDLKSIAVAIVILFGLGIGLLVMLKTSDLMYTQIEASGIITDARINTSFKSSVTLPREYSDFVFVGIFFAFTISLIIMGYFVSAYPIFVIIYIIGLVVIGLVSALLNYIWDNIAQSTTFLPYLAYIPVTNFMMRHLTMFTIIIGFIGLMVMYIGNTRRSGGFTS